jgi:signal transduction histidine kinase
LAVPLIALLTVTVFEAFKSSQEAHDIREQAELAKAATGPNGVFTALQNERNRSAANLIGFDQSKLKLPVETVEQARSELDDSLGKFEELIGSQGDSVMVTYQPAFDKLKDVAAIRSDVDAYPGPYESSDPNDSAIADEVFVRYSDVIDELLKANTKVALAIDDPELRRGADLSHMATRQLDLVARLVRTYLQAGINEDFKLLDRDELREAGGLYGQAKENGDDIVDLATGDYQAAGTRLKEFNDSLGFMEVIAPEVLRTGVIPIAELLDVVSVPNDESYYGFRERVKGVLETKADDLAADADRKRGVFWGLAIGTMAAALLATWWVSRSITRPLRALTRQATDMANHRLPDAVLDILDTPLGDDVTVPSVEPISVQTRDEVADVAEALNTVQDSALDLAVEQAVLRRNIADSFVNLGRRNQNLLGRQLDFITELEHNETDPDTLANLFRLDHLATRMRRNAESLLVLAGIDPPRKWTAPVRITDAIRAALGEVEDYQRVTVRAVEATTIIGSAAADLAHLLAELIENALIFSPPDQTVEIRGRSQPAGYTLAIIDSGLGMPPDELSRANRRLAGAESFTIAPSKYLGHYVAGNLAARHNINVTLHNSPGHGITATINLPPTLLTTEPTTGQGDTALGAPNLSSTPTLAARRDMFGGDRELLPARSGFDPEGDLAEAPAASLATTTASGLAKRTPRSTQAPDTSPATEEQPAARFERGQLGMGKTKPATADDELIRTLSQYTTQLHQQLGAGPTVPAPAPTPAGIGSPHSPATGTPALRNMPPFPMTPPGGLVMPPGRRGRGAPMPPPPGNDAPPLPRRSPSPSGPPMAPGTPPPPPNPLSRPPLIPPPPAPGGAPGAPGQTPAGLTRRVRGAQLPNTQTVSLRRNTDAAGPGATPPRPPQPPASVGGPFGRTPTGQTPVVRPTDGPPPPQPPAPRPPAEEPPSSDGWASERSAKDVYGFLSDFTAGVQRGLDETKASGNGD